MLQNIIHILIQFQRTICMLVCRFTSAVVKTNISMLEITFMFMLYALKQT